MQQDPSKVCLKISSQHCQGGSLKFLESIQGPHSTTPTTNCPAHCFQNCPNQQQPRPTICGPHPKPKYSTLFQASLPKPDFRLDYPLYRPTGHPDLAAAMYWLTRTGIFLKPQIDPNTAPLVLSTPPLTP